MNIGRVARTNRSILGWLAGLIALVVSFSSTAVFAQTAYFRAGNTCAGATTASFSTSGPTFQISLCVDTAVAVQGVCGSTIQLQAANAGESGRFNITARALGASTPDPNTTSITFPVAINNPASATDFGGTSNTGNAGAAGNGQILATFDISPQATATNASYVLGLSGISEIQTTAPAGSCLAATSTLISPTITLNLSQAPAFTSAAPAGGTSGTAYTHTFTASGSPAPTFTVTSGSLPPGLNPLAAGGALTGTPTTPGTYMFTVTANNGVMPNATQNASIIIAPAAQTITFANPGGQPFSASPLASGATASSGLAVTLTSNTLPVCTISGLNIVFVTAGTCTVTATQTGGTNMGTTYSGAMSVIQSFMITAGVPQPPTGVTGSAGFQSATISFTAPTNTGGSAILDYTATCTGVMPASANITGAGSPLTVTGLTNGNTYACSVTARNASGSSGASATVMVTPVNIAPPAFTSSNMVPVLTVATAMPTFNITTSGGPTPTITQSGTLPTGVSFASTMGSGAATLTGTPTTAGSFPITLTATNSQGTVMQSITLTVNKANQAITFNAQTTPSRAFSTTPFAIAPVATTTSPLAITYTSATPTICSVSGTNVTAITVGTCTINANQAGDGNYNAATQQQQSVMITQATQTITFGAQTSPRGFSATPIPLAPLATASSGLGITYSSATPMVCSVSGGSFTPITLGTCTINADQAGNANFSAAPQVQQSVMITQGTQTIGFSGPGTVQLTTLTTLAAAATSGLPVSFASTTPAVCTTGGTNGATLTTVTLGTCTVTASQAGNTNFAAATSVTVNIQIVPLGGIVVTPSVNPSSYRQPVVLDISINGTSPTGTISVLFGSPSGVQTPVCTAVRLVNARASCVIPGELLVVNPMFFTVNYSGDGTNSAGSVTHQQLVDVGAVTMTVASTPLQVVAGRPLTLKAMLVGKSLTNPVTFFENGSALSGCSQVPVSLLPGSTEIGVANCTVSAIGAGDHSYVVNYPFGATFKQLIVPITAAASGPQDYTDMWWVGASENGWGVSITQHGLKQFIVLYVYDASGKPVFYAMPDGTWNAQQTAFTGPLYQPTSAPFSAYDASLFRPGGAVNGAVGNATVTYTGPATARVDFTINGVTGSKQIVRQPFATDDGQPKLQVGDMWWGGIGENGWGINIAQQGRVLFPVWYTYNTQGNATWFGVPGGTWNGNVFTGDIYSSTSSAWLGVQYVAASFTVTKVGTMTLSFTDQSNAIMTYTVNGVTQTKLIGRQPY
jgi:hypothetical protein